MLIMSDPRATSAMSNRIQRGILIVLTLFILGMVYVAMAIQDTSRTDVVARAQTYEPQIPIGISRALWRRAIPVDNPLTKTKVSLGEMLYFDKRLSADGTVSCATCHDPANAFTDRRTLALGLSNTSGTRNVPTLLNSVFVSELFWDGRTGRLEEQAKQPLLNLFEMGMCDEATVVSRLTAISKYREKFQQVFGKQGIRVASCLVTAAVLSSAVLRHC